ncbi:MAG: hypothetical protein ACYTFG_15595 [Planctomycetota bacterium]
MSKVFVITVARKPLSEGSLAKNVLKHGTGAINVDGSRVGSGKRKQATAGHRKGGGGVHGGECDYVEGTGRSYTEEGRWPANLVLEHHDGCRRAGTKTVTAGTGSGRTGKGARGWDGSDVYRPNTEDRDRGFGGTSYGHGDCTETVDAWECVEGCPVADLDEQSLAGGMHPAGNKKPPKHNVKHGLWVDGGWKPLDRNPDMYSDTGGASRFFKQVGGSKANASDD